MKYKDFINKAKALVDVNKLPSNKNEGWKYAPPLLSELNSQFSTLKSEESNRFSATNVPTMTFADGKIEFANLNNSSLIDNLEMIKIAPNNEKELPDLFKELLLKLESSEEDLNPYFFQQVINGSEIILLRIKKNTICEEAIHLEIDENIPLVVISEENCEIDFIETSTENNTEGKFINRLRIFLLSQGSRITFNEDHLKIHPSTRYFTNHIALIKKDSTFNHLVLVNGSEFFRSEGMIFIEEQGAHANSLGLNLGMDDRKSLNHYYIEHNAPETTSNQLYKGIYKDSSHGVFDAKIAVKKDAQKISSQQLNKNLVIGEKAKVDSRPQLIIDADDVKCAHGSTTGQLEEDSLFYLQTRGIPATRGRKLLARAFAQDVIDQIPTNRSREYFDEILKGQFQ